MIRRPPRSTLSSSSAASDVYKRQPHRHHQASQPPYKPSWSEEISHVALLAIMGSCGGGGGTRTSKRSSDGCPTVVLSMPRNSSLPHILPLSLIHISEPTRPY
eukprot:TRINITY_DN18147_c0_g1_i1.p1 TRINITY_DN18147_c0_g1~~TRINITY_DN18147_c0_g1_i1.p1  ORF type:complete len:103 (-),score=6.70 TRINITY_DN18147_c0_g1_i1:12-320(-)